jgi:hypothetical protein
MTTPHISQPIVRDAHGVARFQSNALIQYLADKGAINLNQLVALPFPQADVDQFWQLLGYSLSAYAGLSFISKEAREAAAAWRAEDEGRFHYVRARDVLPPIPYKPETLLRVDEIELTAVKPDGL